MSDAGPGDRADTAPPDTPPPGGDVLRVAMVVAYRGDGFRGFAAQPGQRTVAGVLVDALDKLVGHPVRLTCAGRTDAGVHAVGQVVHFDIEPSSRGAADPDGLGAGVNRMTAPEVVVRRSWVAAPGFDARRSAVWRRYRYRLLTDPVPDPFRAGLVWHVGRPLDLRAMRLACDPLYGEHDFSSFCRRPSDPEASTFRRVISADWSVGPDGETVFDVTATAFCHQMVRSLVGTMVDMGSGRLVAGDMAHILRCADRAAAGQVAPPTGLCLMEVGYPEPFTPPLPPRSLPS